ncbi:MAG: 4Fe-4S ferredoxin [Chloroflexi bacterium]|nr:4Fe-4S ferredoxin [Chloroflexota bacterium]
MARETALVDPARCHPEKCDQGVCPVIRECPRRLLRQDTPFEVAYFVGDPSLCRGCFKCLPACPQKAIIKT